MMIMMMLIYMKPAHDIQLVVIVAQEELKTKTTISVRKKKNGTANPHPPPPPPLTPLNSDEAAQRAKTRHFSLFDIGGGEV